MRVVVSYRPTPKITYLKTYLANSVLLFYFKLFNLFPTPCVLFQSYSCFFYLIRYTCYPLTQCAPHLLSSTNLWQLQKYPLGYKYQIGDHCCDQLLLNSSFSYPGLLCWEKYFALMWMEVTPVGGITGSPLITHSLVTQMLGQRCTHMGSGTCGDALWTVATLSAATAGAGYFVETLVKTATRRLTLL